MIKKAQHGATLSLSQDEAIRIAYGCQFRSGAEGGAATDAAIDPIDIAAPGDRAPPRLRILGALIIKRFSLSVDPPSGFQEAFEGELSAFAAFNGCDSIQRG